MFTRERDPFMFDQLFPGRLLNQREAFPAKWLLTTVLKQTPVTAKYILAFGYCHCQACAAAFWNRVLALVTGAYQK